MVRLNNKSSLDTLGVGTTSHTVGDGKSAVPVSLWQGRVEHNVTEIVINASIDSRLWGCNI